MAGARGRSVSQSPPRTGPCRKQHHQCQHRREGGALQQHCSSRCRSSASTSLGLSCCPFDLCHSSVTPKHRPSLAPCHPVVHPSLACPFATSYRLLQPSYISRSPALCAPQLANQSPSSHFMTLVCLGRAPNKRDSAHKAASTTCCTKQTCTTSSGNPQPPHPFRS